MAMIRHPLSGAEYHRLDNNKVRVVGRNGVDGVFTRAGDWVSGEKRSADPGMCRYVAAARWKSSPPPDAEA